MNIPGIRLIVPLLCSLLLLAVPSSDAKEPEKAKPSPTPKSSEKAVTVRGSKSNDSERTANPKASPTPKPNSERLPTGIENVRARYRTAASPTPKPKAK